MGGHGGLNILPQKKWNVYNRDNRTVVQRDQRLDRQRRQRQADQRRNRQTQQRIQQMRSGLNTNKPNNFLVQQLQKIQQQNKHVNLFEKEQRIIENKQVMDAKMYQQMEFIKDKSIDMSSKFLGAYNNDKMKPWYTKTRKQIQKQQNLVKEKKKKHYQQIQSVKKTTSTVTKQFYKTEIKREDSRERSRDQKVIIKTEPLSKIQQMRQQRKLREEKQRKRANELILKKR